MCRGGEIECPGFPEQAVETKICEIQKCTSGSELVKNVADELRTNLNVDDRKLSFLLRRGLCGYGHKTTSKSDTCLI